MDLLTPQCTSHIEQLADGDVGPIRHFGLVRAHWVIEPQLALINQLQNDCRCHRLGNAANAHVAVDIHWCMSRQVARPQRDGPRALAGIIHEDDGSRRLLLLHLREQQRLELGRKRRTPHRGRRLGWGALAEAQAETIRQINIDSAKTKRRVR